MGTRGAAGGATRRLRIAPATATRRSRTGSLRVGRPPWLRRGAERRTSVAAVGATGMVANWHGRRNAVSCASHAGFVGIGCVAVPATRGDVVLHDRALRVAPARGRARRGVQSHARRQRDLGAAVAGEPAVTRAAGAERTTRGAVPPRGHAFEGSEPTSVKGFAALSRRSRGRVRAPRNRLRGVGERSAAPGTTGSRDARIDFAILARQPSTLGPDSPPLSANPYWG